MRASTFEFTKKVFLALAALCFILGIATQGCSRGVSTSSYSITDDFSDIKWPTSGIATLLPEPESKYGEIITDSTTSFYANIGNTAKEQYIAYVDKCMESGFTVDYNKGSSNFYADDETGNSLSLFYDADDSYMTISLNAPTSSSSSAANQTVPSSGETTEGNSATPEADNDTPVDGIRPSFREAMDSYEDFFDEYCAFMQKYNEASNPASMAADYARFMAQYAETMDKLDAIGAKDLSDQELVYYNEVMTRINQKLNETAATL